MKKTYVTAIRLMVCALLAGLFLTTQVYAQRLLTYRFGVLIPETPEEALVNLTATEIAEGATTEDYFTLSSVGYDENDILHALTLGEFMSFTGDSADPPACNSEPWQPVVCFASLDPDVPDLCESQEDRDKAFLQLNEDGEPLYGGWPCCTYEKAWMYKICPPEGSQLVLNGIVLDERRLAPGSSGKKTAEMPGTTHYRIQVNGIVQGKMRYEILKDNNWHNIRHQFHDEEGNSEPLVLETNVCAEVEVLGIGAQLDDPIPWRIDNMQLLGVVTSDGTYPNAAFTLTAEMAKSKAPKVNLEWVAPPVWTGAAGDIHINRNGEYLTTVNANQTSYTDDDIPGTGEDEDPVDVGIYEVCTSYSSGKTLCSNLATVKY